MNNTQRYAVYHANDMLEVNLPPAMRWYADTSLYFTHVADLAAPLEQIFALTNHIDHPWTDNPEVVWLATSRIRSTSIGDVIVSADSGQAWLVMPVGLQELPQLKGMSPGTAQATGASTAQKGLHAPFGVSQVVNHEEVSRRYVLDLPDLAKVTPLPQAVLATCDICSKKVGDMCQNDQFSLLHCLHQETPVSRKSLLVCRRKTGRGRQKRTISLKRLFCYHIMTSILHFTLVNTTSTVYAALW